MRWSCTDVCGDIWQRSPSNRHINSKGYKADFGSRSTCVWCLYCACKELYTDCQWWSSRTAASISCWDGWDTARGFILLLGLLLNIDCNIIVIINYLFLFKIRFYVLMDVCVKITFDSLQSFWHWLIETLVVYTNFSVHDYTNCEKLNCLQNSVIYVVLLTVSLLSVSAIFLHWLPTLRMTTWVYIWLLKIYTSTCRSCEVLTFLVLKTQ